MVTLTIPLVLPLKLVNEIDAEARRLNCSIPELLSNMLIEACEERDRTEYMERGASEFLQSPLLTAPAATNGLTFNAPATQLP